MRTAFGALWRRIAAALSLLRLWGAVWAGEFVTYYHNDVAGSPVAATDARGYYIWRASYEPYGKRIQNDAGSAAATNPTDIDTDKDGVSDATDAHPTFNPTIILIIEMLLNG